MEKKPTKREENERRDMILVGVLVVLCVLLFGIGNIFSGQVQAILSAGQGGVGGSAADSQAQVVTVTVAPTETPVPTPTPKPSPTPVKVGKDGKVTATGLGVGYETIRSAYADQGFSFENTTTEGGVPRYQGRSGTGMAAVQVAGDPQNLIHASIVVYIVRDKPEILEKNLDYTARLIEIVLPDWKAGRAWLFSSIATMAAMSSDPREISLVQDNVHITLRLSVIPEILYLSLEATHP